MSKVHLESMLDRAVVGRQLRFWSLHCGINAAPSFGMALFAFHGVAAILGMLAGCLLFVAGYTLLTSTAVYQRAAGESLLGRAVGIGTRIRLWLSLASALVVGIALAAPNATALFLAAPDFWAGLLALATVTSLFQFFGAERVSLGPEGSDQFLPTLLVTVTEGLILSFTLAFFSFLALLILQFRRNRSVPAR